MAKLQRGAREGPALPTRYHSTERALIEKYANIMKIAPGVFQRLATMHFVSLCEELNKFDELKIWFERSSAFQIRHVLRKPFVDGNLPTETQEFFNIISEEAEKIIKVRK